MSEAGSAEPLAVLQRIRRYRAPTAVQEDERCDLCGEQIPADHGHLVDLRARSLMCACRPCYLLFTSDGSGGAHFRAVPDRYVALADVQLSTGQWESFQIPVGVAFFFWNSALNRVAAFYPSPAGATESELPIDTWSDLVQANPLLAGLEPDVEAFLVRTARGGDMGCYIVPIDACYELVGHLRRLWRGFDGGSEAHEAMDAFFDRVRGRAR